MAGTPGIARIALVAVGSGIVAGALEAGIVVGTGPLALPAWNVVVLLALGGLGGGLAGAPLIGLALLARRPPIHVLAPTALLAMLAPWVLSLAAGGLLPVWAPPSTVPWWILATVLALAPAAALAPSAGLRALAVCVPLLLAGLHAVPPATEIPPRSTAVLVTVDGLRADALDPDGPLSELGRPYTALTPSPHARAANQALASVLLGLARRMDGPSCRTVLDDGYQVSWPRPPAPSLPILERHAAFVSSDLVGGYALAGSPFQVHDDDPSLVQGLDRIALGRLTRALGLWHRPAGRDANYTVDAAIAWASRQQEPYRLWVHLRDPVGPYTPGDPWDKRFAPADDPRTGPDRLAPWRPVAPEHGDTLDDIRDVDWVDAQYRGEVAKVEYHVARLIDALPEGTPVVVAGTHGELLGEDGGRWRHGGLHPAEALVPVVAIGVSDRPERGPWRSDDLVQSLLRSTHPPPSAGRSLPVPHALSASVEGTPTVVQWDGEVLVRLHGDTVDSWGADGAPLSPTPEALVGHARRIRSSLVGCAGTDEARPPADAWADHVFRLGGSGPATTPPQRGPEDLP